MMIPIAELILFKLNMPSITPECLPVDEVASLCDLYAFFYGDVVPLVGCCARSCEGNIDLQTRKVNSLHTDFQSGACCQFN